MLAIEGDLRCDLHLASSTKQFVVVHKVLLIVSKCFKEGSLLTSGPAPTPCLHLGQLRQPKIMLNNHLDGGFLRIPKAGK